MNTRKESLRCTKTKCKASRHELQNLAHAESHMRSGAINLQATTETPPTPFQSLESLQSKNPALYRSSWFSLPETTTMCNDQAKNIQWITRETTSKTKGSTAQDKHRPGKVQITNSNESTPLAQLAPLQQWMLRRQQMKALSASALVCLQVDTPLLRMILQSRTPAPTQH